MKRILLIVFLQLLHHISYAQSVDSSFGYVADTLQMEEVIISSKTAIKVNGDTISYNVDSFNNNSLATAEDVLKKLPGIQVSQNGVISINGIVVNKITINGKEYDIGNIADVTRSFPAEILAKIQIADYRSEEDIFMGVKTPTEEKTINLQLREEYSHGIYGKLLGGYGTKNRYQAGLFSNYMSTGGTRMTLIGELKNTGVTSLSGKMNSSQIPGVRDDSKVSANFLKEVNERWKLSCVYEFNNSNSYLKQSSFRTTYLENDSLLLQNKMQTSNTIINSQGVNFKSEYNVSSKLLIKSKIIIGARKVNTQNKDEDLTFLNNRKAISFQRTSTISGKNTNTNVNIENILLKTFAKRKRALSARLSFKYITENGDNILETENKYFLPVSESSLQNTSKRYNNTLRFQLSLNYSEPLGKNGIMRLGYDNTFTGGRSRTRVFVDDGGGEVQVDSIQSRTYDNENIESNFNLDYQYSKEKFSSSLGLQILPYNRITKEFGSKNIIKQNGINYAPRFFFKYQLTKFKSINFNYRGYITNPTFEQVNPVPDYTDSLNIFIGNPDLKPQLSHNLSLNYRSYRASGDAIYLYIRGEWLNQKIINNTTISNSKRKTIPINANGYYNFNLGINKTNPLIRNKIRLVTSLTSSIRNNVVVVNDLFQNRINYSLHPGIRLSYFNGSHYEGDISYSYGWNKAVATNNTNNVLKAHNLDHTGRVILPFNITWQYEVSFINNKGINTSLEQQFFLVNTSVTKEFRKIRGLSASIQAFDIFNNYPTVQRSVNDNYYEDISVNRIGNFYLLSVLYRFNSFPSKKL